MYSSHYCLNPQMWNHWIWRANWIGLHSILGFRNPLGVLEAVPHRYRRTTVPRWYWVIRLLKSSKFQVKLDDLEKLEKCYSQKDQSTNWAPVFPRWPRDQGHSEPELSLSSLVGIYGAQKRSGACDPRIFKCPFNSTWCSGSKVQHPKMCSPLDPLFKMQSSQISMPTYRTVMLVWVSHRVCLVGVLGCEDLGYLKSLERYSGTTHGLHLSPVSVVPWPMSHTIRGWPSFLNLFTPPQGIMPG